MIRILGNITDEERALLRRATVYTLDFLLPRRARKNLNVIISLIPPNEDQRKEKTKAECGYNETETGKYARIWLNENRISKRSEKLNKRFSNVLRDLCHELVHVKQYASGELKDTAVYTVFRGEKSSYSEKQSDVDYYLSKWEIEAYGMERGLYARLEAYFKEEANG